MPFGSAVGSARTLGRSSQSHRPRPTSRRPHVDPRERCEDVLDREVHGNLVSRDPDSRPVDIPWDPKEIAEREGYQPYIAVCTSSMRGAHPRVHTQSTRGYELDTSVPYPLVDLKCESYLPGCRAVAPVVTPTTIPVKSSIGTTVPTTRTSGKVTSPRFPALGPSSASVAGILVALR